MLEPRDRSRDDGKRPDAETLIVWCNGKPIVRDVTVVDTVADAYVVGSNRCAGAASGLAETKTTAKDTDLPGKTDIWLQSILEQPQFFL